MRSTTLFKLALALGVLALSAAFVYRLPAVNSRLSWRLDVAATYLRAVLNPVQDIPTPQPSAASGMATAAQATAVSALPAASPTPLATQEPAPTRPGPTPTPPPTPTPLPEVVSLPAPAWEKQDWNNCGPATLAQYLRYYNWEGDQFTISDLLKPERADRNVNVEELVYYVRNRAGWLHTNFRVGGDLDLLKRFLAAGIPVMVEEGYYLDTGYWPNDDRWAGHYLLLTGYDEAARTFTAQDSFIGADRLVDYDTLDENWKAFNRVYILVYLPHQEETVRQLLGPHWDEDYNRQQALEQAEADIAADPNDAMAWFNLGSNLVYFERYPDAARAYDSARELGLPQRMLRYQFGPFFAYFHAARWDDLITLTEYALQRTPNSEEALLWHGWGLYRQGETNAALGEFRAALEANRYYQDAQYALDFLGAAQ